MKLPELACLCFILTTTTGCLSSAPSSVGDKQCGKASWYGKKYAGRPTASGEIFRPSAYTAAHKKSPLGIIMRVQNQANGRSVFVKINDRGPYVGGRIIDLSQAAFARIAPLSQGVVDVCVQVVRKKSKPSHDKDHRTLNL